MSDFPTVIGDGLKPCIARAQELAQRNLPMLVIGETGTGKELVCIAYIQAWCQAHGAKDKDVATMNCTEFKDTLRSELFGHAKGSFTGATSAHEGIVPKHRLIWLDELGDAGEGIQAQLLRLVEYGDYLPVGTNKPVKWGNEPKAKPGRRCVIASTNHVEGVRADLVYRFHGVFIEPLCLRPGDVATLIEVHARELKVESATARFGSWALRYKWPGNARELVACMREAAITGVLDVPPVMLLAAQKRRRDRAIDAGDREDAKQDCTAVSIAECVAVIRHADKPEKRRAQWIAFVEDRYDDARGENEQARSLSRIAEILSSIERNMRRSPADYLRGMNRPPPAARIVQPAGAAVASGPDAERAELIRELQAAGSVAAYAESQNQKRRTISGRLRSMGIDAADVLKNHRKRRNRRT